MWWKPLTKAVGARPPGEALMRTKRQGSRDRIKGQPEGGTRETEDKPLLPAVHPTPVGLQRGAGTCIVQDLGTRG